MKKSGLFVSTPGVPETKPKKGVSGDAPTDGTDDDTKDSGVKQAARHAPASRVMSHIVLDIGKSFDVV